uniref:DNA-directed RNA polymerase subunit beta n=1 Tax=Anthurium amnicola TaxID=1678845 RepID=A0A1D1YIP9_9ARAE
MASSSAIPSATSLLQLRIKCVYSQPRICDFKGSDGSWGRVVVWRVFSPRLRTPSVGMLRRDPLRARSSSISSSNSIAEAGVDGKAVGGNDGGVVKAAKEGGENAVSGNAFSRIQGAIISLPPVVSTMKGNSRSKFAVGVFFACAFLVIVVRGTIFRKPRHSQHGSVADLVKRGQLRSHSRGISRPLRYEDPFNNPLVKVGKSKSTIEMCGKVYRLASVTLTEKQQLSHQKRRSRAYKWKRPTIFLKEGDEIPADVDPDTVRWIPANHPFATTVSDIDEELAQNNVYQKNGVPFRIKAEHEALQKKLEALQREQKLDRVAINPSNFHEFERPFRSFPDNRDEMEPSLAVDQHHGQVSYPRSDKALDPTSGDKSEEWEKL